MDIVACSVLNKDIPDKTNNTNKFKKRSNQEKRFKYQQKDVCSLSKIIIIIIIISHSMTSTKKLAVFNTVLNVSLLWHALEIFHKVEIERARPNWNGLMDQRTSEKNKFIKNFHCNVTTD